MVPVPTSPFATKTPKTNGKLLISENANDARELQRKIGVIVLKSYVPIMLVKSSGAELPAKKRGKTRLHWKLLAGKNTNKNAKDSDTEHQLIPTCH